MEDIKLWSNFSDCLDSNGETKKRYYSLEQAESTAEYLKNERQISLRVYKCSECNYYHLTKRGA